MGGRKTSSVSGTVPATADVKAVCPIQPGRVIKEPRATQGLSYNQRIARAAAICAARDCRISSIQSYEYRGVALPILNFAADTPTNRQCLNRRYETYRAKAKNALD